MTMPATRRQARPEDEPYDAEEDGRRSYALAIDEMRRRHLEQQEKILGSYPSVAGAEIEGV